ncbi:nucleotide exchange factor GrpE [Cellulomonas fimi]|uniref:Protein GrpE n=1 Tax=Cellulomonas fimi (strain ATCC 484 / DSM 20113 / JCM 1341 / CCUG 24087 / LMG 16345 / NBRC 15513 / NCIMB 8980 / NCTC 7547 / NRS-133) TaxID=590998 RepID=F4H7P2_CELFA|nr:nucleotide exchange factor GrpE [Cellulomonas fimi]AEE44599.1 GrpE protein [Cellulomonas fimi ATCC 484]NNH09038.1 nucleotide exchange factor GrpE [Cellulomonas fimi]VEH26742.1 Heat shock protein B25.3 [Cellulomonas fimi]
MTQDKDRPEAGSGQPDPAEGAPRFTDKRRIDPETGQVRQPTPEEQVLADAETIAQGAEEEVVLEGLIEAQKLAAERLEELQRAQAAHYNLEQQYSAYVKRSKADALAAHDRGIAALAEALIPVLDDIELARQHGDLSGPFASIAEKLTATLQRFGVEQYGQAGEAFDPVVHEALMHSHSADVTEPTVQMVLQHGYRTPERILRAARVAVVDPEG